MKYLYVTLMVFSFGACHNNSPTKEYTLSSPNLKNNIHIRLNSQGKFLYDIKHKGKVVLKPSTFSFEFTDAPPLRASLKIISIEEHVLNETYELPWGEQRKVENNGNEARFKLQEIGGLNRQIEFITRCYNDGVAWRYHFPTQPNVDTLHIAEERTEYRLANNHRTWWIPGDWDSYEHLYNDTEFTAIAAISKRDHPNLGKTYIPINAVNTPITMKTNDGIYLSFHEANLTDYSDMTLAVHPDSLMMVSHLVGGRPSFKVERALPFSTPWRTIQIADKASDLIESNLILNLNEPNKLGAVSWFKPTKYVGIWWELHMGKSSWNFSSGKHGATTENAKKYIDFAASHNIGAVLVEGWNKGWDYRPRFDDREKAFDYVTPYEDYDLDAVVQYGKSKGVEIIIHHETSSAPRTYDKQLDTAFSLMQRLDLHTVKSGYVGPIIPEGEYHHGQYMVRHYRHVLETAAKYQVAVNAHEPIKDTGIRRTLPNAISREGLRGQEFNAWGKDGGNPPNHLSTIAFTRMLSGPIDFTPGIFYMTLDPYQKDNQINTTIAHQLALYVVIYSPVQMAADFPEHYTPHEAEFKFISDVGVDWEQSIVLDGEIGDFVIIAREERTTGNWFVGGITDENSRELSVDFSFLDAEKNYSAKLYTDAADAHYKTNPTATEIRNIDVTNESKLTFPVAPGGGFAISLLVN